MRLSTGQLPLSFVLCGFAGFSSWSCSAFSSVIPRCPGPVPPPSRPSSSVSIGRTSNTVVSPPVCRRTGWRNQDCRQWRRKARRSALWSNPPSTSRAAVSDLSLKDLLDALAQRNLTFPPTARRSDLERLYLAAQPEEDETEPRDPQPPPPLTIGDDVEARNDEQPAIHATLSGLAEANGAAAALASSASAANKTDGLTGAEPIDWDGGGAASFGVAPGAGKEDDTTYLPLPDLLARLVDAQIRFSPTARRAELEQLYRNISSHESSASPPEDRRSIETAWRRRQRRRERRAAAERRLLCRAPADLRPAEAAVPRAASDAYRHAARQVRRLSRKVSGLVDADDDGVRDADFRYLYRDEALHRRAHSSGAGSSPPVARVKSVPGRRKPLKSYYYYSGHAVHARRRGNDGRPARQVTRASRDSSPRTITQRPYLLPPAEGMPQLATETDPSNGNAPSDPNGTTPDRLKKRKIYSPYRPASWSASEETADEDELDRLGNFVADVAERFMWGPDVGAKSKTRRVEPTTSSRRAARHWRDRLEEQFDDFLGIHEDGATYNRWTEKAKRDKETEGGHDALSVARGVQPKRHGLSSPGRKVYEKPIWEEEGNLISLLFGRTQSGSSMLFDKLLDPKHGSMLYLFRAVFRSFMLVSSYVCRWASVRGAFPQPVVVLGVFTAAVCAPRHRRLLAVTAALVVFRTLGELLHGYAYGNDGWEDDAEEDEECHDERRATQ